MMRHLRQLNLRSRFARAALTAFCVVLALIGGAARGQDPDASPPVPPADERELLISYVLSDGPAIGEPLDGLIGDAERGRALFADAEGGPGCMACHAVDAGADARLGPNLADVGARLSSGAIRLWIVNPRALMDGSSMPAYYSLWPEQEVAPDEDPPRLEPLLTAQEVEDLTAYLNDLAPSAAGDAP